MSSTVLYMSMSFDGFIAGPSEGPDNGLGDGGERLHVCLCFCSASRRWSVGARAWLVVWVGCARTPSLISVRDPVVRIGDMMVDGVFRDAVRPLCL